MKRIGVDESGKGDYFGCLVAAGVFIDEKTEKKLKELGVKDSKTLTDSSVKKKALLIKKICPFNIVKISPEKYNILYKKFNNLNKMLAWAHARVIENMLEKVSPEIVISDKFGEERLIKEALMKKGKNIKLVQKVRAESDIAVAAASILARAEFLSTLKSLSMLIGFSLPKGSTRVEKAAKEIMKKHGSDILPKIAKIHFKITKKIKK